MIAQELLPHNLLRVFLHFCCFLETQGSHLETLCHYFDLASGLHITTSDDLPPVLLFFFQCLVQYILHSYVFS